MVKSKRPNGLRVKMPGPGPVDRLNPRGKWQPKYVTTYWLPQPRRLRVVCGLMSKRYKRKLINIVFSEDVELGKRSLPERIKKLPTKEKELRKQPEQEGMLSNFHSFRISLFHIYVIFRLYFSFIFYRRQTTTRLLSEVSLSVEGKVPIVTIFVTLTI